MAAAKMIRCQICGVAMRKNRMATHIEKVHINPGGPIFVARPKQLGTPPKAKPAKPRRSTPKPPRPKAD